MRTLAELAAILGVAALILAAVALVTSGSRGPGDALPGSTGPLVGRLAPPISGLDLDGESLKLTDQRGKVVLLVFWASWCGPCRAEIPELRALLAKQAGKPFVILGANRDENLANAQQLVQSKNITWRNWRAGVDTRPYDVDFIPAIFVIDHLGMVRAQEIRGVALERTVELLVQKAAKAPPAAGGEGSAGQ